MVTHMSALHHTFHGVGYHTMQYRSLCRVKDPLLEMECSRAEAVASAERGEAAAEGARTAAKDAERAKRTAERKLVRPSTNKCM